MSSNNIPTAGDSASDTLSNILPVPTAVPSSQADPERKVLCLSSVSASFQRVPASSVVLSMAASHHFLNDSRYFINSWDVDVKCGLLDGSTMSIAKEGIAELPISGRDGGCIKLQIKAFLVPGGRCSYISMGALTDVGYSGTLGARASTVEYGDQVLFHFIRRDGLWCFPVKDD